MQAYDPAHIISGRISKLLGQCQGLKEPVLQINIVTIRRARTQPRNNSVLPPNPPQSLSILSAFAIPLLSFSCSALFQ
jgi:hypothetical protein